MVRNVTSSKILGDSSLRFFAGLTAKVFRTYNASFTLQNQLDELTEDSMSVPEKLLAYNRANRAVAILCNHQRAVPKTHDKSMENLREKIRAKKEQIKDVQNDLKVSCVKFCKIWQRNDVKLYFVGHQARISQGRYGQGKEEETTGALEGAAGQTGNSGDRQR